MRYEYNAQAIASPEFIIYDILIVTISPFSKAKY